MSFETRRWNARQPTARHRGGGRPVAAEATIPPMSLADYPAAIQLRGMPPRADPQLVLSDPVDPNQDGYILSFRAELTAAGLTATTGVVVAEGHDLDAFFDRLVASWRGWQGEQVWEALEHQMSIAASHDGTGHIRLRVTLRQDYLPDAWEASATFVVEAGEELRGLASRIARFQAS
jgi:hypothetical protein